MEQINQPNQQGGKGGNTAVIIISVLLLGVAGFFIFKSLKKPKKPQGDKAKKPQTDDGGILGGILGVDNTSTSADDTEVQTPSMPRKGSGGIFGKIRKGKVDAPQGVGTGASADTPIANGQLEDSLGTTVGGTKTPRTTTQPSTSQIDAETPPLQPKVTSFKNNSGTLPYKHGQKGNNIILIQKKLGIVNADGKFGQKTFDAVWNFQQSNPNLSVDGSVGKNTWKALFGVEHPKTS